MNKFLASAALALTVSLTAAAAHASELITNGGFETGDFSGWTNFDNTGFTGVQAGVFISVNPTGGDNQSYFGPVDSTGGITQTIATVGGNHYTFSFDLFGFDGGNFYSAAFDGVTLLSGNGATGGYDSHVFDVIASGASTAVTFTFQHNPSYYLLDNVSVTDGVAGVPEPASWALMLTGFLGAGSVLRANRRRVAVATA
jgi:hypothetical protein